MQHLEVAKRMTKNYRRRKEDQSSGLLRVYVANFMTHSSQVNTFKSEGYHLARIMSASSDVLTKRKEKKLSIPKKVWRFSKKRPYKLPQLPEWKGGSPKVVSTYVSLWQTDHLPVEIPGKLLKVAAQKKKERDVRFQKASRYKYKAAIDKQAKRIAQKLKSRIDPFAGVHLPQIVPSVPDIESQKSYRKRCISDCRRIGNSTELNKNTLLRALVPPID